MKRTRKDCKDCVERETRQERGIKIIEHVYYQILGALMTIGGFITTGYMFYLYYGSGVKEYSDTIALSIGLWAAVSTIVYAHWYVQEGSKKIK